MHDQGIKSKNDNFIQVVGKGDPCPFRDAGKEQALKSLDPQLCAQALMLWHDQSLSIDKLCVVLEDVDRFRLLSIQSCSQIPSNACKSHPMLPFLLCYR